MTAAEFAKFTRDSPFTRAEAHGHWFCTVGKHEHKTGHGSFVKAPWWRGLNNSTGICDECYERISRQQDGL